MSATGWTARAACASRLDLPWLTDAGDVTPWEAATMQAICAGCPALFDCLGAVDALDVSGGWWAGADRDPHPDLTHLAAPGCATDDRAALSAAPVVAWVPVRGKRGRLLGEQACLPLGGVA